MSAVHLLALLRRCLRAGLPALAFVLLVLGSGMARAQTAVPSDPLVQPTPAYLPPPTDPEPSPYDDAAAVGISAPASMVTGGTAYVTVTMQNTGTTTWYPGLSNPYRLGSQNPADNTTWGIGRVELGSTVAPGGQAVFGFTITAPATPGSYGFSWAMLREGLYWFGNTASSTITVSAPEPVYDAQLVSASVPATMTAGSYYNVSMTFKNTGNVTWTSPDYLLGNADDLDTFGMHRVSMSTSSVAPGQSTTFNFQMHAPATAGTYTTQWGMVWEYHRRFGQTSTTYVTVNPVAVTPKPTISVSRPSLVAGQSFTTTWSTTDATSLTHVCTASGSGYTVNESLAVSGSRTLTAQPGWVGYPSSCTWTASGAGGSATYTETMTTVAGTNSTVTYIHTDGLGSPVARTDANGNPISRTRYEPYGYVASGVQPTIGFTGHVNDVDTGLTYMQQRYYDPVAGRFLSIDPVTTDEDTGDSFNRYAYAENNSYKYIDPDGRQVCLPPLCILPPPPPVVTVTNQRPRSDPFVSPVQSSSQQGDPVARKLVEIYNKLTAPSSASPPPDDEDPVSKYLRTTKGRSVENRETNVGKEEFKRNLRANGWKERVSKDGQTTILEKDGARYVIRDNAGSTGGPTADFYKANSSSIDLKIRLGGN